MELGQSGKIEQNLPFLYLILANCPLKNKCLMTGYHSLRDNWGHQYAADRNTFPLGW